MNGTMYHVYILLNEAGTRTYTGVTDDVNKRLDEHNAGRVKSSNPYRPYKLIHTESFETLSEARQKEKFYKSTTGRRRLKGMFFKQTRQAAHFDRRYLPLPNSALSTEKRPPPAIKIAA